MRKSYFTFLLFVSIILISCKSSNSVDILTNDSFVTMSEADYRPVFHFTPLLHWMNDPNGLVYYKGKYHLFYQYNPNGSTWGPMNWGHAVSTDLFNWQDLRVALTPDNLGTIFSGSAVVDSLNTTGFKYGDEDPLVAIFTHAGSQQKQSLAYSYDGGYTWVKYSMNPVLSNPGIPDFRDPKVMWFELQKEWVMTLATGNKVSFYSSPDLKNWTFESYFGEGIGAHGGVWECPDLFQLPVEGTNQKKWVLLASINPGAPNGGSGTQYFVGNFDGHTFSTETTTTRWIDYGTDNYAGVTYNNIPTSDGRRLFIGWMSNWNYAGVVPTTTWRSTMTVPRVISLVERNGSYELRFNPVSELANYLSDTKSTTLSNISNVQLDDNDVIKSGSYEASFTADLTNTDTLTLSMGNKAEDLTISFNKKDGLVTVDRSKSGYIDFNDQFKKNIISPLNLSSTTHVLNVQVVVDKTSLEFFWNNGENVMTVLYFPKYQYNKLSIQGNSAETIIKDFSLKGIKKSLLR